MIARIQLARSPSQQRTRFVRANQEHWIQIRTEDQSLSLPAYKTLPNLTGSLHKASDFRLHGDISNIGPLNLWQMPNTMIPPQLSSAKHSPTPLVILLYRLAVAFPGWGGAIFFVYWLFAGGLSALKSRLR